MYNLKRKLTQVRSDFFCLWAERETGERNSTFFTGNASGGKANISNNELNESKSNLKMTTFPFYLINRSRLWSCSWISHQEGAWVFLWLVERGAFLWNPSPPGVRRTLRGRCRSGIVCLRCFTSQNIYEKSCLVVFIEANHVLACTGEWPSDGQRFSYRSRHYHS